MGNNKIYDISINNPHFVSCCGEYILKYTAFYLEVENDPKKMVEFLDKIIKRNFKEICDNDISGFLKVVREVYNKYYPKYL